MQTIEELEKEIKQLEKSIQQKTMQKELLVKKINKITSKPGYNKEKINRELVNLMSLNNNRDQEIEDLKTQLSSKLKERDLLKAENNIFYRIKNYLFSLFS